MFLRVPLVCLVCYSCLSLAAVLQNDEDQAVERIYTLIETLTNTNDIANPAAKLVRLSFHDCVGGCDGCLNLDNADNNGLQGLYAEINDIYNNEGYSTTGMSRADFIALAGTIAVRQASSQQQCNQLNLPPNCEPPSPTIQLKYGRTDCPTSPTTTDTEQFPNPHGDLAHVIEVFGDQMNMTVRQIVAILGAHTLGAAVITQSGFRGPWVPQATVFSNDFYRQLSRANNDWFQEEISAMNSAVFPESRFQWTLNRQGPNLLMLNTDVAIWKFIQPDSNGTEVNATCRANINDCPPSETASIVLEFANSNTAFLEAFGPAFQVLIENGYSSSELTAAIEDVQPSSSSTTSLAASSTPQATTSPTGSPDSAMGVVSSTVLSLVCLVIITLTVL